jgi:Sec-independent protein translocase protein TatA
MITGIGSMGGAELLIVLLILFLLLFGAKRLRHSEDTSGSG